MLKEIYSYVKKTPADMTFVVYKLYVSRISKYGDCFWKSGE